MAVENKKYVLDEGVVEHFEFEVGGHRYKFRYPNTEEIFGFKDLLKDKEGRELEVIYTFIEPVDSTAPSIQDVMAKKNAKVLANFGEMVKSELGLQ